MGFFDKVRDVLTSSDAERARRGRRSADEARRAADDAARAAEEAARRASDPADGTSVEDAAAARETAQEAQREAAEATVAPEQATVAREQGATAPPELGATVGTGTGTGTGTVTEQGQDAAGGTPERYRTVTVQPGDTLSALAERHGADWHEVATLNGIDDPDLIYPGQVFKLPHG